VQQHGGAARVEAGSRGGARFVIDLPHASLATPAEEPLDAGARFGAASVRWHA
jgi:hypothetical protein